MEDKELASMIKQALSDSAKDTWDAYARSSQRGALEAVGGGVGGAGIGAAAARIAGKSGGAGALVGGTAGYLAGAAHGSFKGIQHTFEKAREDERNKSALKKKAYEIIKKAFTDEYGAEFAGPAAPAKKSIMGAVKGEAKKIPGQVRNVMHSGSATGHYGEAITGKGALAERAGNVAKSVGRLASNKVVLGAGGVLAAGVAAKKLLSHNSQEKQAALRTLVENGLDFNTAAELVIEKSAELYGE